MPKFKAIALSGLKSFNRRSVLAAAEVDEKSCYLTDFTRVGRRGAEDCGSVGRSGGDRNPAGAGLRG